VRTHRGQLRHGITEHAVGLYFVVISVTYPCRRGNLQSGGIVPRTCRRSRTIAVAAGALTTSIPTPINFFTTEPALTDGIKFVLLEALSRLSADNLAPAMYRLEMTFGGGKPHRLTALPHLAFRASEFTGAAEPLIDGAPLPAPGEC
jgi:hypothetical protein